MQSEENLNEIIQAYKDIVSSKGEKPSYSDFLDADISRDKIRRRFGGIENLHDYMRDNDSAFLQEHFSSVEDVFSKSKNAVYSDKKRFIVTTAVADSEAHLGFLSAIDTYCKENDAAIVIMPAESITNSFERRTATFDKVFNDEKYLFVQENTHLNNNVSLCSIQVSAKQIKPITGLTRIGKREGSYVFASPKQFLEYVPTGSSRGKNYAIMTPGACTLPKYYSETFVSKRLSYIAEHDHTMGAIIIEIQDDTIFHFRQIQCDEKGDFIDLGKKYTSEGTIEDVPVNVVYGDLHGVQIDDEALSTFTALFAQMKVKKVYLHDVFDGNSISHHIKDIAERQRRSIDGGKSLENELEFTHTVMAYVDEMLEPEELVIVKSNHDEFLTRYLASGRFVEDEENHYLSLKIAVAQFEGKDVLKHAFEVVGKTIPNHWNFLKRDDSSLVGNVECGAHGDLGLNGARPSMNSLEKIYGDCVTAHSHSAAIQRGAFRVGTLTKLDLGYNRGPSSWTHTCCLVYDNGQRQLINCVDGKCTI
jgi:hypothetical protein